MMFLLTFIKQTIKPHSNPAQMFWNKIFSNTKSMNRKGELATRTNFCMEELPSKITRPTLTSQAKFLENPSSVYVSFLQMDESMPHARRSGARAACEATAWMAGATPSRVAKCSSLPEHQILESLHFRSLVHTGHGA